MRPLTDEETRTFFEKLAQFIGRNIKALLDRSDERYCFRLHRERVYYVSEKIMRMATNIARDNLALMGTCFGKFTKSGKFRLRITALDLLAKHAQHKVWVKPSAEMTFLYGNHIVKSGLARMTEGITANAGVIILSMNETPLGFGVAAQSTERAQEMDPTGTVVLHQADIGEYVRAEDALM
ncbi:nip7 [Symbiodinium sp. KB8]|nr:nip7 [Symbiodinium sp. KB8]